MRSCWVAMAAVVAGCAASQVEVEAPPGGDGDVEATTEEELVVPTGRRLASGVLFGCLVGDDQRLRCWRAADPLAGADDPARAPALADGLAEVAEIAASGTRACALAVNGTILCWTEEPADPRGGGEAPEPRRLAEVGLRQSLRVSLGGLGVCAVHRHGEVRCAGFEGIGGDDAEAMGDGVVQVTEVAPAVDVSVGGSSACALRAGGQVACWARGEEPARVAGVVGATGVSVGDGFACAVESSGRVLCWGDGRDGQLGDGAGESSPTPVEVVGLDDAEEVVVAGGDRLPGVACARRRSGEVLCWGGRRVERPGPLEEGSLEPVAIGGVTDAAELAIGDEVCARRAEGRVRCWRPVLGPGGQALGLRDLP